MKKIFKIIGILVVLIVIAVSIFILTFEPKKYSDFGVFTDLRTYVITTLKDYNATERPITQDLSEFCLARSSPL